MGDTTFCPQCGSSICVCEGETTDPTMVVVPAGTKIKAGGSRYETTAETTVPATMLEETPKQTNPRIGYVCPDETCRAYQRARTKRGGLLVMWVTPGEVNALWAPQCGGCGSVTIPARDGDIPKRKRQ